MLCIVTMICHYVSSQYHVWWYISYVTVMFSGQLSDIYFVYFVRTLPFSSKGETLCLRDNLCSNYITKQL